MNNPITTISRERLEEMSQCSDVTTLFAYEMRHMARALLAVMDAKPIGYFRDDARGVFRVWPTKSDDCNVPVYTTPPAPSAPEWSNEQIMEFLAVAFRHGSISGDITMDDIRLGVKMANSAAPGGQ